MIIKYDDEQSEQPTSKTTAIPTSKPFELDCIHRERVTHGQALNQADDEDDSFTKGYN